MKMAKASEKDIDAAGGAMSVLHDIGSGYYPKRDELLEALERLIASGDVRDAAEKGAITQARAAIAKVEGGAT